MSTVVVDNGRKVMSSRRTLVIALITLNLLFLSNTTIAASAGEYTLESGEWQQLSIPGNSASTTVQNLFADDLPAAGYGSSWIIYRWDATTDEYVNPGLAGSIPTGAGFWMLQQTGAAVVLDAPDLGETPVRQSSACASDNGCSEIPISSGGGGRGTFTMIGAALPVSHTPAALRLVTTASNNVCAEGCSHDRAAELGLVSRALWRYEPAIDDYTDLTDSGALNPWESTWVQVGEVASDATAQYLFPTEAAAGDSGNGGGECLAAPNLPPLAESDPGKTIVRVSTEPELQRAISSMADNTVILIAPGIYQLSSTLWVNRNNITIRGDSNRCDAVRLVGPGMENVAGSSSVPHGIFTDSNNLKVQNLAIENVYFHPIAINSNGQSPQIYNVLMLDAGEQFVKASSAADGNGSSNGRVEYSVMKYTNAPPTTDHGGGIGYTQGVDIHSADNWVISNNHFENFHTPDSADHLYSPVVLAWNSSSNTIVENNVFIDVDRAIAFGLVDRNDEHRGGIIRNNTVVLRKNLFSEGRRRNADAPIIVWGSPDTQVLHNTVLTNGNTRFSIQLRFNSNGAIIRNNLIDGLIGDRSSNQYVDQDNVLVTDTSIFRDAANGDLHLKAPVSGVTNAVPTLESAANDIDGTKRRANTTDAGADEL